MCLNLPLTDDDGGRGMKTHGKEGRERNKKEKAKIDRDRLRQVKTGKIVGMETDGQVKVGDVKL